MKRYHFFPYAIPKGITYEINTLMGYTPNYRKTAIAWQNALEFLQQKWFRRFPYTLFEPWVSWEAHATGEQTRFFFWAPDETYGQHVLDGISLEHFEFNYEYAQNPYKLDYSKAHWGMKLFLERDFSVPIEIHKGNIDSLTQLVEHLSNVTLGQELLVQYLVRPVYDKQVMSNFKHAIHHLHRDRSAGSDMYIQAIHDKMEQMKAEVAIKIIGFANTQQEARTLTDQCYKSLASLNSHELNRFVSREWWQIIRPMFRFELENRIFPFRRKQNAVILGTPEMSGMLRWPTSSGSSKLIRIKMQWPPAPVVVRKIAKEPNTIFVGNSHRFIATYPIYFRQENLDDHIAVIGAPNSGKSSFILNLIDDLIKLRTNENRIGFTLIDTKGTLANNVLARIPPELHEKVKVVRGRDGTFPFNPYMVDYSIAQRGGQVVDIIARADSSNWQPIVTETLLLIGYALDAIGIPSLRNVQRVIEEPEFCNWVLSQIDDSHPFATTIRRSFAKYMSKEVVIWPREFFGSFSMARLRNLNTSGISKMINSYTSGVKWLQAWEEGQYLIFDLSGMSPGDQRFLASCIISHFELGMVSREQKNEDGNLARHPLIIDESSGFIDLFGNLEMIANFYREFNMPMIFSTQGLKNHLPSKYLETFFRNFGTHAVFQLGNKSDAQIARTHLRSETFALTDQDFYLCNSGYCYMQHTVERSEVFILKPKDVVPAQYTGFVEKLAADSLKEALTTEKKRLSEVKLGTKPIEKETPVDTFEEYVDELYENDTL